MARRGRSEPDVNPDGPGAEASAEGRGVAGVGGAGVSPGPTRGADCVCQSATSAASSAVTARALVNRRA